MVRSPFKILKKIAEMDKKTALKILFSISKRYKKELCDKKIIIRNRKQAQ